LTGAVVPWLGRRCQLWLWLAESCGLLTDEIRRHHVQKVSQAGITMVITRTKVIWIGGIDANWGFQYPNLPFPT